jgi:formate hydrogenlyase subunit 4
MFLGPKKEITPWSWEVLFYRIYPVAACKGLWYTALHISLQYIQNLATHFDISLVSWLNEYCKLVGATWEICQMIEKH